MRSITGIGVLAAGLLASSAPLDASAAHAPRRRAAQESRAPVLIQGALASETSLLVQALTGATTERVGRWTFWRGTLDGYPIVVSRTGMGGANAAAATALAIEHYHPRAILSQGTASGDDPSLQVGDIVVGTTAVSIAAFKSPYRAAGRGANVLGWTPIDVAEREGDVDGELHEGSFARWPADSLLVAAAHASRALLTRSQIVDGAIGSSDVVNQEIDRIRQLHSAFGTMVEEMEAAPAAQTAAAFRTPFLGIRVVTANVTNDGSYDAATSDLCQRFALQVVRVYLSRAAAPRAPSSRTVHRER